MGLSLHCPYQLTKVLIEGAEKESKNTHQNMPIYTIFATR